MKMTAAIRAITRTAMIMSKLATCVPPLQFNKYNIAQIGINCNFVRKDEF